MQGVPQPTPIAVDDRLHRAAAARVPNTGRMHVARAGMFFLCLSFSFDLPERTSKGADERTGALV